MRRREGAGWSDAVRGVGHAVVDLLRAELDELGRELRDTRGKLVRILVIAGLCLFLSFWLLAVLLYVAVQVAGIWLPPWGAALAVAGLILLALVVLGLLLRSALRKLDSPVRTVQKRVEDHVGWWSDTLGRGDGDSFGAGPGESALGAGDRADDRRSSG